MADVVTKLLLTRLQCLHVWLMLYCSTEPVGFSSFPMSARLHSQAASCSRLNVFAMRLAAQETKARSLQNMRDHICVNQAYIIHLQLRRLVDSVAI